jgi:uncharacterized membrane protein
MAGGSSAPQQAPQGSPPPEGEPLEKASKPNWLVTAFGALRQRLSGWLLVVLAATGLYCFTLGPLAVLKYETFNATFADLGLENEVEWLLLHGGIGGYLASGFAQIYPIQFQEPIQFLFLPIYALSPGPLTLILAGTIALGVAAIPLYAFSRRLLKVDWEAAVVAICYLIFFPIASANLFDFHWEDFTPFFFFFMAWAWAAGHPRLMYLGVALTASIDPLTLVIAVAFLIATSLPTPGTVLNLGWFRSAVKSFRTDLTKIAVVVALLLVLLVYRLAGTLYTAGAAPSTTSGGLLGVLLFDVNDKLLLLVLLLAPFAFLSLYSLRGLIVAIPYAAFVFDSVDSSNFTPFGLFYTLLGACPLIFAAVDALATIPEVPMLQSSTVVAPSESPAPTPRRSSTRRSMIRTMVLMSVVFALVFFPLSPANAYVTGGYFAGNHSTSSISTPTPATEFLNRVIALVPPGASVLTQNNIPQLSGRTGIQVPPSYLSSKPYDVILMDSSLTYFSDPSALYPYINQGLANGTFGVAAEGEGAIMLERGFHGPPLLYEPVNTTYLGTDLSPYQGVGKAVGSTIVGSGPGFSLWFGPYTTLLPGSYSCTFLLESNETTSSTKTLLTIDVTAGAGSAVVATEAISALDFSAPSIATALTLQFSLQNVTLGMEFRGMYPTGLATITLEQVRIVQTSASS